MPFVPRHLEVQRIAWASGALATRELPKAVYRGLLLKLSTVVTNDASGSGVTLDGVLGVVSKLAIVIDGQDTIVSINARDLYYMNYYDFGVAPESFIFTTNSTQGTSYVHLYLPFILTRAAKPEDTLLDARKVSTIVLEVTWGTGVGDGTMDSGTLEIWTDEYANAPEELAVGRHEMSAVEFNLDSAAVIQKNLEVGGNNQYRRLFIFTRATGGALDSAQISKVAVRSRAFYYFSMADDVIQHFNKQQFGIASSTGVYVITFIRDGQHTQRLDARNLSELVVELTSAVSNGTCRLVKDKAIFAGA